MKDYTVNGDFQAQQNIQMLVQGTALWHAATGPIAYSGGISYPSASGKIVCILYFSMKSVPFCIFQFCPLL